LELDVDSFKAYNDGYGHVAGDQCLERIADVLARHARRPGDLAARLGGDEFALLLSGTGYEASGRIARELRREVESLGMRLPSSEPASAAAPATLVALADRALYRAKNEGRNRAVQLRLKGGASRRPHGGRWESAASLP